MKTTLIKVKEGKSDNHECESDTCEGENAQKMTIEKNHQNISTNATK